MALPSAMKAAVKRVQVLLTGDELLDGQVADINGSYLARQLRARGLEVVSIAIIGDDQDAALKMLRAAQKDVDMLVLSGGLGCTSDDLTREILAEFADCELSLNEEALAMIAAFWTRRGRQGKVADKNAVLEARLPSKAQPIPNPQGIAPGIRLDVNGLAILALPGVPRELRAMIEDGALDSLPQSGARYLIRELRVMGMKEPDVEQALKKFLARGRNPVVGICAGVGEIRLTLRASGDDEEVMTRALDRDQKAIRELLGPAIFSEDGDELARVVLKKLASRGECLVTAESLTGGLIASLLTDTEGASLPFRGGFVCYQEASKVEVLAVDPKLIRQHGVVSEAVALAMAEAARLKMGADWALATTGWAGPQADPGEKVGTAWVAVAGPEGFQKAEKRLHLGDREAVKRRAALHGLDLLRLSLRI